MASPILNFQSISGRTVTADYENLPTDTQVVFVDKTSGITVPLPITPASGSGTLNIQLQPGFPPGAYVLQAQDLSGGFLAQSVQFFVADQTPERPTNLRITS